MANKKLYNYKLSTVGMDNTGQWARITFFVYDVKDVDTARREVRKGTFRRKIMRQQNVDWRTAELRAVRCNGAGGVADSDHPWELEIMSQEHEQIDQLHHDYKYGNRPWLLTKGEK